MPLLNLSTERRQYRLFQDACVCKFGDVGKIHTGCVVFFTWVIKLVLKHSDLSAHSLLTSYLGNWL